MKDIQQQPFLHYFLVTVFLLLSHMKIKATFLEEEDHSIKLFTLLEGEDTEEKVQHAIDMFSEIVSLDLSQFKSLPQIARGEDYLSSFEEARGIFYDMAENFNRMIAACHLLFKEHKHNESAHTRQNPFNLNTHDKKNTVHEDDYIDFNRRLRFSTLLLKMEALPRRMNLLHTQLSEAFEKHNGLKENTLHRNYKNLAAHIRETERSFDKIHSLYSKPTAPIIEDVKGNDFKSLKFKVASLEEASASYAIKLGQAKAWEKVFKAYHKKYTFLVSSQEKLHAAFQDLEKLNPLNPHLRSLDMLSSIEGEVDLEVLKVALEEIVDQQNFLTEELAVAKKWQRTFEGYQKTYRLLSDEQNGLKSAFQNLRESNPNNPELKVINDLPRIDDEPDLNVIKDILDEITENQRPLTESLVLAKQWKPDT